MATTQVLPTIANFPPEMVAAAAEDAGRDADRVGLFLHTLGLRGAPEKPLRLPLGFLPHLGAALRLYQWEAQDFFFHRAAGLPEARQAMRDAVQSLTDPNADPSELCVSVLRLAMERFAWHARRDLDADVALDDLFDDAALDALAEYLWASRHVETAPDVTQM
jgi:hypothetical protein